MTQWERRFKDTMRIAADNRSKKASATAQDWDHIRAQIANPTLTQKPRKARKPQK